MPLLLSMTLFVEAPGALSLLLLILMLVLLLLPPLERGMPLPAKSRCRDSILYRLVLAYFMAHDHWASQHNITIMYPGHFPTLAQCIPVLALSSHCRASLRSIAHLRVLTHLHILAHLRISPHIFTFHRTSSRFTVHLCIPSRIFAFHRDLVCIIAGASIHCPASSLVCRIPFITISDYVWHRMIIISLWTLTLPHLHT